MLIMLEQRGCAAQSARSASGMSILIEYQPIAEAAAIVVSRLYSDGSTFRWDCAARGIHPNSGSRRADGEIGEWCSSRLVDRQLRGRSLHGRGEPLTRPNSFERV